jgi:V8-like Glu-specific endopeptidase
MKRNFFVAFLAIVTIPALAEDTELADASADAILRIQVEQQPIYLIPGISRELLEKNNIKDNTLVKVSRLSNLPFLTKEQRIEALELEYARSESRNIGAPISAEESYLLTSAILRGSSIDNLLTRKLDELQKIDYEHKHRFDFLEQDKRSRNNYLAAIQIGTQGLEMSIGPQEGSGAVRDLSSAHKKAIPLLNSEVAGCQGGMDDFNGPLGKKAMNCFVGLDANKYMISLHNSDRKTYLKGLRLIGSIVDDNNRHLCMASIYKKGVWITAKHCLSGNKLQFDNYLKTAESTIKIETVRFCKDCDVAFIDLPTPQLRDVDYPEIGIPTIMQDPIFMPGIALHDSLANIYNQENLDLKYMWSEIGKGYCKAIKIEPNGCMVHGCSAVPGFSGAPMYIYKNDKLQLIGILSGANGNENKCSYLGSINYALALKNREDLL